MQLQKILVIPALVAMTVTALAYSRAGQLIQVAYDKPDGIDLPIQFWAESGATSPPETKLPRKTDAKTNLTIKQADDEIEYTFDTKYSNGNQLQPQKLATHFQFYGRKSAAEPEQKLLHQATYSMLVEAPSGLGGAKAGSDEGSGSFKLDGYYLSGVRLFHQHKGTLDPVDYARSEFKKWKDEIARD